MTLERQKAASDRDKAATKVADLERMQKQVLTLRAPRAGVIGVAPRKDDIGKWYEVNKDPNQNQPLFTVNEPTRVRVCLPIETPEFNQLKENLLRPSDKAAATRRLLGRKVTVAYDKKPLEEVLQDLKRQVRGLNIEVDPKGGLSKDRTVTYGADKERKERLDVALDGVLRGVGGGYIVESVPGTDWDGWVLLRANPHERGSPEKGPQLVPLDVTLRIQGLDSATWKGKVTVLPESDPKNIPMALSNKAGGPVAVKATNSPSGALIPQTQVYLVFVDIDNPDHTILPGNMSQVKIYCRPETCLRWAWRKINDAFNLGLI
jgi:hypothetical protein